ncbi:MAG: hypothetical protein JO331_13535 [Verrucomicrobia bacterium]|nr:hypothetical protein [Verrucomicrobiota bacterium]
MRSHLLGMLEPASILEVNRYTGCTPGVTANRRQKPRVPRSLANGCPALYRFSARPLSALPALFTL